MVSFHTQTGPATGLSIPRSARFYHRKGCMANSIRPEAGVRARWAHRKPLLVRSVPSLPASSVFEWIAITMFANGRGRMLLEIAPGTLRQLRFPSNA